MIPEVDVARDVTALLDVPAGWEVGPSILRVAFPAEVDDAGFLRLVLELRFSRVAVLGFVTMASGDRGCAADERPLQGRENRWTQTQGFTLGYWNAPFRLGDGDGALALWSVDRGQWSVSIGVIVGLGEFSAGTPVARHTL